jgi:DNA segregation ATPase FtsK/SpoIIIE-like protein
MYDEYEQAKVAKTVDFDLLAAAARLMVETGFPSNSMLQRKLGIGLAAASVLLDALEYADVIGPRPTGRYQVADVTATNIDDAVQRVTTWSRRFNSTKESTR